MATPAPVLKRPVGRPRKIPRTKEEEEEFKRRQMKAMALKAAKAQMMRNEMSGTKHKNQYEEEYLDDDDEDFDEEDLDDDDFDSDDGMFFDARSSNKARVGRPRIPKPVRPLEQERQNKSLMCKPIMMTKATSCNPIRVGKITQTEFGDPDEKKLFIPVEFPLMVPAPMAFNAPTVPCFVPVPLTISIPNVTPMHKGAIDRALLALQELYDTLPEGDGYDSKDDAKLADILKRLNSDVEEIDDQIAKDANVEVDRTSELVEGGSEEKVADGSEDVGGQEKIEDGMEVDKPIEEENFLNKPEETQPDEVPQADSGESNKMELDESQQVEDDVQKENQPEQIQEPDEVDQMPLEQLDHMQKIRNQSLVITQKQTIIPQAPFRKVAMDDTQMKLKYTYGVKAYKYWAIKKNAELKAAWKEICQKDGVSIPPFKPVKTELLACSMSELSFYLGSFVNEITKPTGEVYYPDTIFYFCLGIQYYLSENGRSDDIFHEETFVEFIEALNSKLFDSQLRTNLQGLTFCHVTEDNLWEAKYLGSTNPYTLLETLIYLNTKNFLLPDVESHLGLSFSNVMKQWKKNVVSSDGKPARTVYLKYNPYSTIQAAVEKKHRIDPTMLYEQLENVENPLRCPVKLYEFYLSKCPDDLKPETEHPENIKHRNDVFYLQPEPCCVPSSPVWFTANQLDQDVMSTMITRAKVVREVQESFLAQRTMPSSTTTTIQHALANGQAFFVA